MEERLGTIEHRLDRIEQILPTLATKDDLKAFATKDDLKAFATKDDLQAFATKVDLRAAFEEAMHLTRSLHEDLVDKIKLLAESRPKPRR
jgi:hypothetical protein